MEQTPPPMRQYVLKNPANSMAQRLVERMPHIYNLQEKQYEGSNELKFGDLTVP